jgi:hypothetical protein
MWAEELEGDLPVTLIEFDRLSTSRRKAVYDRLGDDVRARLWVDHLTRVLSTDSSLNAAQRAFLSATIQRAPEYTGNPVLARQAIERDSVRQRAVAIFSREQVSRIFATLGSSESESSATPDDANSSGCQCSITSDFCLGGAICNPGGCPPTTNGCGLFWCYPCVGYCGYIVPY